MHHTAIIGANYGDEGKGVGVHYACHQSIVETGLRPLVVRFNGGPQAGHTVQLADGRRRIFSMMGSGSYLGCDTCLSEFVSISPIHIVNETTHFLRHEVGVGKMPMPTIFVDPDCQIITPWDILLNQLTERARGADQHGTCGMGLGESVQRKLAGVSLTVRDLQSNWNGLKAIQKVYDYYEVEVQRRNLRGIFSPASTPTGLINPFTEPFFHAAELMLRRIYVACMRRQGRPLVFEGAQGLLLDQDDPDHQPHVTWSSTGLKNVMALLGRLKNPTSEDTLTVRYMTRPYLTRHGTGPMLAAVPGTEGTLPEYEDRTNVTGKWQGPFRRAKLDWEKFYARTKKDFNNGGNVDGVTKQMEYGMICYDQDRDFPHPLSPSQHQPPIYVFDGLGCPTGKL